MRHTLKWSFFIGTAVASAVLALLKIFQPIKYGHLVLFGYAFVGASVLAGYVAHKNLEKRNYKNVSQNIARTDGGNIENADRFSSAVKRVPVGVMEMKAESIVENKISDAVPDFVPASKLLEANGFENNKSDDGGSTSVAKQSPENEAENVRQPAEKFLDEIEQEEVENEVRKTIIGAAENNAQQRAEGADKNFLRHCGRCAKILTSGNKTISGKFAGMDTHVVLEDALCGSEKKALILVSKSEIARMEIE